MNPEDHQQIGFKLISDHPFNAAGGFDVVTLRIHNWDVELEFCLLSCHQNATCKSVMTDGSNTCYLLFY